MSPLAEFVLTWTAALVFAAAVGWLAYTVGSVVL